VITRITVDLVPRPEHAFAALAFFPNLRSALEFTVAARRSDKVTPRSLELVDRAALDLVGVPNPEGVTWPAATGAAIYFKQNVRDETDRGDLMTAWWELLEAKLAAAGAPALLDHVLVAEEGSGRDRLRAFRHRIPATLHETVRPFREHGGGKLGTDWWIPFPHIPDFLTGWSRRIAEAGLKVVIFGHIGNGHPHVNFLPRNAAAMTRARALVVEMCREAVALGGGVAGEHGLGKLKRDLLAIQYPGATGRIRAIKTEWDPKWILGRGNIVLPESGGSE
jgi:FAD/FMN-containing dehydrogenase